MVNEELENAAKEDLDSWKYCMIQSWKHTIWHIGDVVKAQYGKAQIQVYTCAWAKSLSLASEELYT